MIHTTSCTCMCMYKYDYCTFYGWMHKWMDEIARYDSILVKLLDLNVDVHT